MIWYEDEELQICFDNIPHVCVRYPLPSMTVGEKEAVKEYPFTNKRNLMVTLVNKIHDVKYEFTIPKGYCWDGATIPRLFWRLIGAKTDPQFLIPSLVHDVLCENHNYIDNDRHFSTVVFERCLYVSEVSPLNRWIIKHSVDSYQKFFGGWQ